MTMAIRGAEIVRQLMIYSGQDKATLVAPVDLSQLVEEMIELLKVSISKHVVLKTDLSQRPSRGLGQRATAPANRDEPDHQRIGSDRRAGRRDQYRYIERHWSGYRHNQWDDCDRR